MHFPQNAFFHSWPVGKIFLTVKELHGTPAHMRLIYFEPRARVTRDESSLPERAVP